MSRTQSVVSLDPISQNRKRQDSVLSRAFKTRHYRGKGMSKTDEYGAYIFVGKQRQGKTTSMLWYYELLTKYHQKKNQKIHLASNMGLGHHFERSEFHNLIHQVVFSPRDVYIFLVDELQSWYPKDTKDRVLLSEIDALTGDFSQLGKRQIYVLATAQVYGRINKNLREQALYMVDCRRTYIGNNRCVNDFIPGDDILCDDLGRWSGIPTKIKVHGLPETSFDAHLMIKSV